MTTQLQRFDTTTLNRALIGFDSLFYDIEKQFANSVHPAYPPYNILKISENDYIIEIAVTGFLEAEVKVAVDQSKLVITAARTTEQDKSVEYLHRGLAARNFERIFTLADHMQVTSAVMADGLLKVQLERIVPEALKPRSIVINAQ